MCGCADTEPPLHIEMPAAFYSASQFDRIEHNGRLIGVSALCSYTANVRGRISVCMIDEEEVAYGREVGPVWGEPNGGSGNPAVERHPQTTIRATVSRRPLAGDRR
ncbi:hypothetical protein ABZ357_40700 [Streptomyces sp. NPDC005917]|uniref:hypothetical protein n=1 Tax=unclassified Streptomyces TaxID=2593676 RepID=UPI0033FACAAB